MSRLNLGNTPGFICLQVAPVLFRGGAGVGKTTGLMSLAAALGRRYIPLIGSTHLPEDFSGYPIPDTKAKVVRMMPCSWVEDARDGDAFVHVDEVTNVPSATQAGLLSVITERIVGDEVLPPSTIIVGSMNPPELCPNAVPLAASMRSRFVHFDWVVDYEHWFEGLRSGCEWKAPEFPIVPDHWTDSLPQFGSLLEAFLRSATDAREVLPKDEETLSFPNPRTWTYLVKCFAAAEACGYQWDKSRKDPIFAAIGAACVGAEHSSMFLRYAQELDLVNPEAYLANEVEYEYVNRPDANICLLTGLVRALRTETNPDRWTRAAEAFIEVGNHEIETFLMAFRSFFKPVKDGGVRPNGWTPPVKVLNRLVELAKL